MGRGEREGEIIWYLWKPREENKQMKERIRGRRIGELVGDLDLEECKIVEEGSGEA